MSSPLIDVRDLRKTFRSDLLRRPFEALEGVDLEVHEGEIFGFLGPNGAGKTTTIKILLGLIRPTSGSGTVLGRPFGSAEARRELGFLPDSPNFYRYLTARELLRFTGRLHEIPSGELERRIENTLDRAGLANTARRRSLRTYSRGMLQRTGIAAAILHRPRLLVLDEPMNGLDPLGRREFRDLILGLKNEGMTVLLSSHVLGDVESTADRVGILDRGRLIQCGRLEEILSTDGRRIEIAFEIPKPGVLDEIASRLGGLQPSGKGWIAQIDDRQTASELVHRIVSAGGEITSLARHRVSLEEFFVRQVSGAPERASERPPQRAAVRSAPAGPAPAPRRTSRESIGS